MEISNKTGFTFRRLIYERKAIPEDLWLAFWSGEFECRGKCQVTIDLPPNEEPATRDLLVILYPDGRWVPNPGQTPKDRRAHWGKIAEIPQYEIDSTWLENTFGRIRISPEDFDAWQKPSEHLIDHRVRRVLNAAEKIKQENPGISDHETTRRLLAGKGKLEGYGEATIRKIIGGQYPPAN